VRGQSVPLGTARPRTVDGLLDVEGMPRHLHRFVLGYEQQRADDNAARAAHKADQERKAAGDDSGDTR